MEESIKDGLIITATSTGYFLRIFFAAANVTPPKASLDATDVTKLAGEICGGVLVKY